MATIYAALVSLSKILKTILHPSKHCISFDREQIMSLDDKVCSLVDLLEVHLSNRECKLFVTDELMQQMANAGHEAEDIIDSYVADVFRVIKYYKLDDDYPGDDWSDDDKHTRLPWFNKSPTSTDSADQVEGRVRELSARFCEDVKRVTETMDLMHQKFIEVAKKIDDHVEKDDGHQVHMNSSLPDHDDALSRRAVPISSNNDKDDVMVGFEDHLEQMTDRLASTESKLQIIPIVGMAGTGKTTLAKNLYEYPSVVQHFQSRTWVTISQTYTVKDNLLVLLNVKKQEIPEEVTNEELGEQLYQSLFGRKYLIVIDDIWSITAWDELKKYFPDNRNGSRIMITTRLSNIGICLGSDNFYHELKFLDEEKSWNLFCKKAFPGKAGCPLELEEIGNRIAKHCRGLPLAIVVIGGFLAKSSKTPEYWRYVAGNLNSIINSEDDDYCLKVLSLSYSDLPIHLKPCFLYMAMFPEDCEIKVSRLVRLWVAEGFLKPIKDNKLSLEDVAMVYLKDLIDRNLILVSKRGRSGKMTTCKIHDVLRDLCIREAHKENFLCAISVDNSCDGIPKGIESTRRLALHHGQDESRHFPRVSHVSESASIARSLLCESEWISKSLVRRINLLRVLDVIDFYSPKEIGEFNSLRYVSFRPDTKYRASISLSMYRYWNLQTSRCHSIPGENVLVLPLIWDHMTELRHLSFLSAYLPDPPTQSHDQNFTTLENLQTLMLILNFKCTEEVVKRMPNIRKLQIEYEYLPSNVDWSLFCLHNLVRLQKLESLVVGLVDETFPAKYIAFPHSLKRLTIEGGSIPWEDISIIGSLPNLEVLDLINNAFEGPKWDTGDEFVRLKYLRVDDRLLKEWTADNTNFPVLEHLCLKCPELDVIPFGFAEISTLQKIELRDGKCRPSVITSARDILEEREDLEYKGLQVYYSYDYGQTRVDIDLKDST